MSDHRRKNRNIFSNRKGFSSIVGAVFAILVIVSLTGTFFVWSLQQNTLYVDAVRGVDQLTLDRQSESLNVTSVPHYTGSNNMVSVAVDVQNDGPIYINITTFWVQDLSDTQIYGYASNLNHTLSSGQPWSISETVQVPGDVTGHNFTGWLITQRGNVMAIHIGHLQGDPGATGPAGQNGSNGANGLNGATWYVGTAVPPTDNPMGAIGDFYLNNATHRVYHKIGAAAWEDAGTLNGPTGANGSTWYIGTAVPPLSNPLGTTGDFYFNNATNFVYSRDASGWHFIANLTGAQGSTSYDANTALVAQGIGSICLDFTNLTVYNLVGPFNATLSAGMSGYNVYMGTKQDKIALGFSVNLTNMNPSGTIYLNSSSVFFSLMPYVKTPSQPVEAASWYIVNVNTTTRVINATYSRIDLPYNVSKRVYFAAFDDLGVSSYRASDMGTMQPPTTCPINLALIGNIVAPNGTSLPFGQNLPFVSIYVRSSS